MTRALDEQSMQMTRTLVAAGVLNAVSGKGEQLAGEITRVTDEAVKAIEAKGFVFALTVVAHSEKIARLINETAQNATTAVTRTLGQLQEAAHGVAEAAETRIARTLQGLHGATGAAIEESKKTAAAAVADMLQTHGTLRSDSTVLFERLREANILLQELLGGAHLLRGAGQAPRRSGRSTARPALGLSTPQPWRNLCGHGRPGLVTHRRRRG
jgi:hypothetical protein